MLLHILLRAEKMLHCVQITLNLQLKNYKG